MTIEERIALANARPAEEPTEADLQAIAAAEAEGYESAVPLEEFMKSVEGCSGKLSLRIPRSLHKRLKQQAMAEGVSLNQYAIYKLTR